MEITRRLVGDLVVVELNGRVDGYWSDHLSAELADVVGEGRHHIRLDCSRVTFLSSAGIGVLMAFHKELERISGSFQVVNASASVAAVLRVTRLETLLIAPAGTTSGAPVADHPDRLVEHAGVGYEVFDLDATRTLTCRAIGTSAPLFTRTFTAEHCVSLAGTSPVLAIGVGAFGGSFSDCRTRFGELVSVAGATAYQPSDDTNVADYLVASGPLAPEVRLLYGLACDGQPSHLLRFESSKPGTTVGIADLVAGCLEVVTADALGVVVVAEAAGLIGAALRRSPGEPCEPDDATGFFDHPGVRERLSFTTERSFVRTVALAAGVVTRSRPINRTMAEHVRPLGLRFAGHLHAAAFRFRPIEKGHIDLNETVSALFEPDRLLGVLHLLSDDRGIGSVGESELIRGACWVGPIL
jgi:anti-anti-sigma factor